VSSKEKNYHLQFRDRSRFLNVHTGSTAPLGTGAYNRGDKAVGV